MMIQVFIDGFKIAREPFNIGPYSSGPVNHIIGRVTLEGSVFLRGLGSMDLSGLPASELALTPDEEERLKALARDVSKRIESTIREKFAQ